MINIFVDGSYGTAGLLLLKNLKDIEKEYNLNIVTLNDLNYKREEERYTAIKNADIAILCLPEDAAIKTMEDMKNVDTIIIDVSPSHRLNVNWTYGFPELNKIQSQKIKNSQRIANPGCFATGMLSLLAPIQPFLNPIYPLVLTGVTGYSAGGKKGIAQQEKNPLKVRISNFTQIHRHMEEVIAYSHVKNALSFNPIVGDFKRGQLVQLTIFEDYLSSASLESVNKIYQDFYQDQEYYKVVTQAPKFITPEIMEGNNGVEIYLSKPEGASYINVIAMYDNLGKGAAGAVIQTLKLLIK